MNRESIGGGSFANNGAAGGASKEGGQLGDTDKFLAVQGSSDIVIFGDKLPVVREAGIDNLRNDFYLAKTETDEFLGKGDFDSVHFVGGGTKDFLKRSGGNDSLDLAFDVFDEFFLGEAVAIGGGDSEGVVLSIKIDAGEGGATEVVGACDNYRGDAGFEFVNIHFVGDSGFFVDFGELRKIVGKATVNSGRILAGGNSDFGALGLDGDVFAARKITDEFGKKLGGDGDDTIFGTRNREVVYYRHIEIGGNERNLFLIYTNKDVIKNRQSDLTDRDATNIIESFTEFILSDGDFHIGPFL